MFNINLNVRYAVRLAITAAAAAASSAALSQSAAVSTGAGKELEEVIVTGSRIQASPNDVSVAPVTTISAADIEKTGLVRVEAHDPHDNRIHHHRDGRQCGYTDDGK